MSSVTNVALVSLKTNFFWKLYFFKLKIKDQHRIAALLPVAISEATQDPLNIIDNASYAPFQNLSKRESYTTKLTSRVSKGLLSEVRQLAKT